MPNSSPNTSPDASTATVSPPVSPAGSYDFGGNWRSYLDRHLTPERVAQAESSLREFLRLPSLHGLSFLDIGCGSGLFSYCAYRLGAARVLSFDVNPRSVGCCRELWFRAGAPEHWQVVGGSALDTSFMEGLGEHDIVYSWGVLHHTGHMWRAIELAAARVKPGGLLYIAIYNRADGVGVYADGRVGSSRFWEREKRLYNRLPRAGQVVLEYVAAAGMLLTYLLTLRNPAREIKRHASLRGMSWMVDLRDWIGGYPY
jgi:2-polyprenyl-3-methyl-5-hydroxy-6-metoxy-1,4-benzoquinol methylase